MCIIQSASYAEMGLKKNTQKKTFFGFWKFCIINGIKHFQLISIWYDQFDWHMG